MILVIAEKPSLGRDIASVLPGTVVRDGNRGYIKKGEYIITWVFGHMLSLKEPEDYDIEYKKWSLEALPIYFDNWGLKIGEDSGNGFESKAHRVNLIGDLLKDADSVIHAGDPDEEGQLLIDEILDWFNYAGTVKRLNTGDTTEGGLKKALLNMKDNSECRNDGISAYARSVADMMVGVNVSRFFSCNNKGVLLSVGRVQTPALGLVVNRDMEIEGHSKLTYYDIYANVEVDTPNGKKCIKVKYSAKAKDDNKIKSEETAESIIKELENKPLHNIVVEKKEVLEDAPLPFNLVKLQSYCSSHFGYNPTDVMNITQSLRETHKAITYNRSDCQYLSEEHFKEAPKTMAQVIENISYKPKELDMTIKSKCFNDKFITAHFAIIPTNNKVDLKRLTEEEKNVYLAICKYYMAQFLPKAKKDKRKLSIDLDEEYNLAAHATKVLEKGYLAIFKEIKEEEVSELSEIEEGTYSGKIVSCQMEEKETKPPLRYTKATLNEDMTRIAKYVDDPEIKKLLLSKDRDKKGENGSIGTSATRSSIIDGLIEKKYLAEDGKRLISTPLGRELYRILPDEIKRPDLTAKWWAIQEDIKSGEKNAKALTDNVLCTIKTILNNTYPSVDRSVMTKHITEKYYTPIGACPMCGGNVIEREKAFSCSSSYKGGGCKFVVFKNPGGMFENVTITLAMMKKLLDDKSVKMKKLVKKNGETFDAEMKLEIDNTQKFPVRFMFAERTPVGTCLKCGGDVIEGKNNFSCKNNCGFKIWKTTEFGPLRNITVSETSVKKWLKGKSVASKKLLTKDGDTFEAEILLKYDKENDRIRYEFEFKKEAENGKK